MRGMLFSVGLISARYVGFCFGGEAPGEMAGNSAFSLNETNYVCSSRGKVQVQPINIQFLRRNYTYL